MPSIEPSQLLEAAADATAKAHAPYSKYQVGAALLAADGTIITGCNVENASYGLSNCAERTAVFSAICDGHKEFESIAVVGAGDAMPYPCGACRQVLCEFCGPHTPVYVANAGQLQAYETMRLGDLLPKAFALS